ncbi:hypothetical protein L207DRAFT_581149 [Hyaloscypha variabilis F]|uniref:Uncharacterized protein n=1 Tax=Hyaloscypha variabilis (strain UAMH 11265 / GT02V1 / F) TaxID=1149755 RepID=A0A2J6RVE5_HYAVF|nr:hypothetical protein L207DRAFT_581149 [Hyaloscypha variabilis F]
MPFDYREYQRKCDSLTVDQLQAEYENYTRQLAGGATSTATSVLFSPFTAGISLVGIGLLAPRVHNARKKREIIEAGLQARGKTHRTRKRDVLAPVAVAGTLSGLTLGLAGPGADMIAGQAVGHGMEYAASHVALDATGAIVEHKHGKRTHQKAHHKLQTQYQYQDYQQSGSLLSQVSPKQSVKPPASPVAQPDLPPAYQFQPQDQNYGPGSPLSPQHAPISYQPASHSQIVLQSAAEPHTSMSQTATYNPAQHPHTGSSPVSMPSELESPSVGTYLPALKNSATRIRYRPVSGVHVQSMSDTLGPKSDESLHITVYELDSEPAEADEGQTAVLPQITMEQEIAFLKAKILEMEIEKREGANRTSTSTNPSQTGPTEPTARSSIGKNEVCQIQLEPFEPELSITPALASLVEHQNFHAPPIAPTHGVTSPSTLSLEYALEDQKFSPSPTPLPAQDFASPSTSSSEYPSDNQILATSLYPAPLRLRSHSAHIPGYHYPPPLSPAPSAVSPITPSPQVNSGNFAPTVPPPRPHSTRIPGYHYPPPSSLSPSILSPNTSSVQYTPDISTSTTSYFAPPLPPRPHSAHIPDHQPSAPNSSTTINSVEQQEGCEAPPLLPRPKQHRPIQRQDSGYYSNPPSRHSSTFSNTSLSTCCSP